MNASDTRNKSSIQEEVLVVEYELIDNILAHSQISDIVMSRSIGAGGRVLKRVVVMDEVDGMGGSDRFIRIYIFIRMHY